MVASKNNFSLLQPVHILYPDNRQVPAATVIGWAVDSFYNNADWYRCYACGHNTLSEQPNCQHAGDCEPMYNRPVEYPLDLESAIAWLGDTGEVTFAKR